MPRTDLAQGWNDYQRTNTPNGVREAFSMDEEFWADYMRSKGFDPDDQEAMRDMDTGELRRLQAQGLVDAGMVKEEHRDLAFQQLERNGGRWLYQQGSQWDPETQFDSYTPDDQGARDALQQASDTGHGMPDSSSPIQRAPGRPPGPSGPPAPPTSGWPGAPSRPGSPWPGQPRPAPVAPPVRDPRPSGYEFGRPIQPGDTSRLYAGYSQVEPVDYRRAYSGGPATVSLASYGQGTPQGSATRPQQMNPYYTSAAAFGRGR